ncbi:FAD/NAD(P)-binding protein [Streptomyces sp. NPDC048172]|uniref:FAD/NAD(P)-binding protein n=1 Tax=Streptomyces sp. NPDC048172 TaxID=3365505 RepID=UPI0037118B87
MDIAVIGGGAAAVALLDALAVVGDVRDARDGGARGGTVTVFEPSPRLWRGRPYGPDLDAVRVNAPPALMSVRHGDFGHYAAWLGDRAAPHADPLFGRSVVPRALYGAYLEHTAEKAVAGLGERGWAVRVVPERVTGAAVSGDRDRIVLRTAGARAGREFEATRLALCVGGGSPRDLYGLAGAPGFVADPYPLAGTLPAVPTGSDVAVVGSGLTAVDVVVALAARGHTGRIALLSRSGVLPHVWQRPGEPGDPGEHRPRHLTPERVAELHAARGGLTLDDLAVLLRTELAEAGEDFGELAAELLATPSEDPVRRLRAQLAAVDDPRIGRRVVQTAAHTVGPAAWPLLPAAERERLRRHARTAVSVASPMVPVNAAVLLRLLDSGQLTLVPGVRAVEPVNGRFRVRHDGGTRTAETVLNAVNPPPQAVPAAARHLVGSLVDAGLATREPSGGILPADPRVRVVGDLRGDGPFLTASIPGVAAQATAAARAFHGVRPDPPGRRS